MKKLLTLGLAIVMIMAMAIALVGCGVDDIIDNVGGGGNNGEEMTETMKSKKDIKTLLGDNYEITLKYGFVASDEDGEAAYITTKNVGDSYYTEVTSVDGNKDSYLVVGNKAYTNYDEEVKKFKKCVMTSNYNPYPNVYETLMTSYEKSISYNSKKSDKYLGRDVTIYNWKETSSVLVASISYEYEYVVDKDTGLILKQTTSVSGASIEGAGSASTSFEVTKMTVKGITLTEEMKKIAIDEWPTDADFTTFGVDTVAKIDGEFVYSNAIIEDSGIASEKEYTYKVKDATIFDTLSQSFYGVGFKKDYSCEEKPIAELKTESEYSHVKKFNAYKREESFGGYGVEITLTPPYSEGGDYTLTISLYDNTDYE